jgi:hypothetical protein
MDFPVPEEAEPTGDLFITPPPPAHIDTEGTAQAAISLRGTSSGFVPIANNNLDGDMELTFGYHSHKNIYTCLIYWVCFHQFSGSDFASGGWFHGPVPGAVFAF